MIWGTGAGAHRLVAAVLARLRLWWWISGLYADGQTLHALAQPALEPWRPDDPADAHERLRALSSGVTTRPASPRRRCAPTSWPGTSPRPSGWAHPRT